MVSFSLHLHYKIIVADPDPSCQVIMDLGPDRDPTFQVISDPDPDG